MKRGSSSTYSRSSSDTRWYHMLAPTSQVDESLFGSTTQISQLDKHGASKVKNQSQKNQEEETVQIITRDLICNLRISLKDPSRESIIVPSAEFERITSMSRVLTKKEREALKKDYQRKKEEDTRAAEERKCQIYEADLSRKDNQALTELEHEAQDHAQSLVEKASALTMEEEQEIKQLNKCQATRDAQIQEKKRIQAELLEEENHLDGMMEVERRQALETVERINELRRQEMISGMQKMHDQIQQHLEERQVEDVMKEKEKQQIRENQEKINLEDLKALEKKREEQKHLQEEIVRINNETIRAKEQRREEERLADMRDEEYRRNKMKRQAEYEAEERRIRKEKDLEIAKLRAGKERRKTTRQSRTQQEALIKQEEEEEEEKQRQKAHRYSEAIQNQVKARELSVAAQCREISKEADRLIEEARQRHVRLDEVKNMKLKELRATGLLEIYCSEVERKAGDCSL